MLALLSLLSIVLTIFYVIDLHEAHSYPSKCEMTYSWPVYSNPVWAPPHAKYTVHGMYMKTVRPHFTGIPVLFVPGHLGSYRQARSITRHLWDLDEELFDVFTLDFQEELTALHGQFVMDQATYMNEVIRALLKQYRRQVRAASTSTSKSPPAIKAPDQVIIVAHSMGGIAARVAETLPNFKRHSIALVVTLGTPFDAPPFPFDASMAQVYERMRSTNGSIAPSEGAQYVSIAGGHKDITVHAALSSVSKIAPEERAMSILAPAMPSVQTSMDHLALLWCHQLLRAIAQGIHGSVNATTRAILPDVDARVAILQEMLLGAGSSVLEHAQYVSNGYAMGELERYDFALPVQLWHILRARHMQLFAMVFVLVLWIFQCQVARWQQAFQLQDPMATSTGGTKFPSFLDMLSPWEHSPAPIKVVWTAAWNRLGSKLAVIVTAAMVVVSGAITMELGRHVEAVHLINVEILVFVLFYWYALGLVHAVGWVLALITQYILSPLFVVVHAIARRLRLTRSVGMAIVYALVFGIPHVEQPVVASRAVALIAFSALVCLMLEVIISSCRVGGKGDHRRYQATLCAFITVSMVAWVGKVVFFAMLIKDPPAQLSSDALMEVGVFVVVVWLAQYVLVRAEAEMLPLPPIAFFGATSVKDAMMVLNSDNQDGSQANVNAANCPKCVYEDGGPGAVFIQWQDKSKTRRIKTPTEVVVVGPTFRVIECDCVYRFDQRSQYCAFCTRSCRLCGGGGGNYEQAQKYREYMDQVQAETAMQGLVPVALLGMVVAQVTYGINRAHLISYYTPATLCLLLWYNMWLRHPLEVKSSQVQAKRAQRQNSGIKKKKKKKRKSTTSGGSATQAGSSSTQSSTKQPSSTASAPSSSTRASSARRNATSDGRRKSAREQLMESFGDPILEEITPESTN